jgi:hypothetical protein
MNRRVIPVGCGGCWVEAVEARRHRHPVCQVRQGRQVRAWIPSGCDWPLLSLGVASLGHCSSRLLGDLFSLAVGFLTFLAHRLDFLTRLLASLTHLLAFITHRLDFLTRLIGF